MRHAAAAHSFGGRAQRLGSRNGHRHRHGHRHAHHAGSGSSSGQSNHVRLVHGLLLEDAQIVDVLQKGFVRGEYLDAVEVLLQLLNVALLLGPSVLEPSDHLRIGESQRGGDLVTIGGRQILLVEETLLQLEDLMVCEGGARLALLLRLRTVREYVQVRLICKRERERLVRVLQ